MKGLWEVIANPVGGAMLYGVARLRNAEEVKHSGNLEFHSCGYLKDQKEAEAIAEQMNRKEDSDERETQRKGSCRCGNIESRSTNKVTVTG